MANFPIKQFLGLRLTADPEIGTAATCSNFKRNLTRSRLENADGVATLTRSGHTTMGTLPTNDSNLGISALAWKKVHSFYIADDGGATLYAAVGTYTKTAHGYTGFTLGTSGVWVNKYHNGSAWQDGWRELTEFYIFRYASAANVDGNQMDITLENTGGVAPSTVAANVTEGWVAINGGNFAITEETGFKVVSMTGNVLRVIGQTGDISTWTTSTKIYVYRNNFNSLLPSSIVPQIRNVLDELRVTTGNSSTDLDIALFYRDKIQLTGVSLTRKGTFAEYGHLNVPTPTFKIRNGTPVNGATDGLPAGTYEVRASLQMDDGQETDVRQALVGNWASVLSVSKTLQTGISTTPTIATNGTHVFASTWAPINIAPTALLMKIDSSNTIVKQVVLDPVNDGIPVAIFCSGGYLYMFMHKDYSAGYRRMVKYDENLNFVSGGTWTLTSSQPTMLACTNGLGSYAWIFFGTGSSAQLMRYSFTTLNYDQVSNIDSSLGTVSGMAADGTYVVVAGSTRVARWSATNCHNQSHTDYFASLGSVACSAVCIIGGTAYVGQTTKIKKWVMSTDTITDLYTGGDSDGWFGYQMANDGTYLYGVNDAVIKKIDLTGSVIATYTQTDLTDLVYPLIVMGSALFGATINANMKMFITTTAATTFISDGYIKAQYDIAISPGYIPRRAKYMNIYINKDGGPFYLAKQHDLLNGGVAFSTTTVWDSTVKHRYYQNSSSQTINSADFSNATVSATSQLGRILTDAGLLKYKYAITANNRTYAAGVMVSGKAMSNKVYLSALSGDGISQYDVLPNDVTTILDVEFNDGDYVVALGQVADRVLVLKNRSLVLLTPNSDGTHNRDIVATGVGIAAKESLVAFNESLYWLDSTGVWEFSTRGLTNKSEGIAATILGFSDANREAAVGVVDPRNLQYRLLVNGTWYVLDLKDGEWTTETWPSTTVVYANADVGSTSRRYLVMTATLILAPAENILMNGNSFTMTWQSNKIELPLERGYDGTVSAIYCDYTSPVDLSLKLYLDDDSDALRTYTLPWQGKGIVVPAPIDLPVGHALYGRTMRCKSFRIEISATSNATAQNVQVRRLGAYFNQLLVGGDRQKT